MSFYGRLLAIFFPERCAFCGEVIRPETGLCPACREQERALWIVPPLCPVCGREKGNCGCGGRRRHFERCVTAYVYQGPVRSGILRLKKWQKRNPARYFAAAMARRIREEYGSTYFSGIVPVPLSKKEFKQRGYNQSRWLAEELSVRMKVPVADILVKLCETRPQKELCARERSGNLLGVFDVKPDAMVEGHRFLLVDDVITTGSTLDECAKMLKIYGSVQVLAVTAAATCLQEPEEATTKKRK